MSNINIKLPQAKKGLNIAIPENVGGVTTPKMTVPQLVVPQPAPSKFVNVTPNDTPLIREAIAYNETRGQKNPYGYSRNSGSKAQGKALGRFQVTEGELKTYAPRFLNHPVNSKTFLQHPELQDQYMDNKIDYLITKKLPLEKVLAAHRGGFSDFDTMDQKVSQYQGYVDSGVTKFNELKSNQE